MDDNSHLMAIRAGVLPATPFWDELQRKIVYTLAEFIRRAQRAVNLEETKQLLENPDASTSAAKNPNSSSKHQQQS